jgi:RNA polymerase sigma factor (sigma-70 family)
MSDPSAAFAELLAKARGGDNDAMLQLIQQYEPEIRRLAHHRVGPALRHFVGSMDLVQSVHRSLMLHLRDNKFVLTRQEDLTALAATFLVRKVSLQWRKVQLEEQAVRIGGLLRAKSGGGEDPATAAERRDRVQHLLEQADDKERRLLELHLEDRNTKEIAAELQLQENVVRVLRSRLFRKLREHGIDPLNP